MNGENCQTVLIHLPNESAVYAWFEELHMIYQPIHTYVSIIMCIFGALANFCNIVVLTRPQMRTPVNMILTAMACCDTVVLFSNLVYTTHYSFVAFKDCHPRNWNYNWALFIVAHAHLSLVGHSSSVWLSVMLALVRYLTLRSRGNMGGIQIGLKHSYIAIASTVLFVAIVNAPNFLTYKINEGRLSDVCKVKDPLVENASSYIPVVADIALAHHCLVFRLAFWISGLVFKVMPCCLLSLFVWLLLGILKEVKANRQRLLKNSRHTPSATPTRNAWVGSLPGEKLHRGSIKGRGERADRTTHMLLAIVVVMLVTEMPQGIMALLSGLFSEQFRTHIYNKIGDVLDLLSLCGACMSFIIYCSMSGQFRNEFKRVFLPRFFSCKKKNPSVRRQSDTYTKMTYLRATDCKNGNGSICSDVDRTTMKCSSMDISRSYNELATSPSSAQQFTPSPVPPKADVKPVPVESESTESTSRETIEEETGHAFLEITQEKEQEAPLIVDV
ncbi:unnamed protein product [Auanema sp. JU1783]|nr:unnamed protein product [Auanema sp. JU1783]